MINTPFGINLVSSLMQGTGLQLNPITSGLVGTSHTTSAYTPGTLLTDTCLLDITNSIQAAYNTLGVHIDTATYANLIAIGSSTIPALGNSKPPSYSWIGPANSGDPTSTSAQEISWYPYTATATTNVYPSTNPTPKQWSNLTQTTYNPNITQWGWIRLFALQAWNEFNYNGLPSGSSIVYKDFLSSFQTCSGFLDSTNQTINAISNSLTFLKNTYSNNDDLITADITGVNLATYDFGRDLIALGRALDLSTISTFGLPSNLLKTMQKNNALTGSVTYAIISSGMTPTEINEILNGQPTTKLQEQQIYGAFSIIVEEDLQNVLIPLNCSTKGLTNLTDLLNPLKLFPNSYASLTVPVYNATPGPTNSKTYYQIYNGTGVNMQLSSTAIENIIGPSDVSPLSTVANDIGTNFQLPPSGFGSYSRGIIPDAVSIASGAFSFSMQQISNISNIPIEKFAQVVSNLETSKGLPLTAGTSIPTNETLNIEALNQIAYGSGPSGTFTMSDFFGCMTGLPYQWTDIKNLLLQLQTTTLSTIYQNIYTTISTASTDVSATVQTYINNANNEINNILINNPVASKNLNRMWDLTGTQLTTEQRARDIALSPVPSPRENTLGSFPGSIIAYVNSMQDYSKRTEPHMHSQTIESISDTCSTSGQSQVALMRAIRNAARLLAAGIPVDNTIPTTQNTLTTKILMGNGTVSTGRQGQGVPAGNATFTIPADPNVLSYSCTANEGTNEVSSLGHFENAMNSYCVPTKMNKSMVLGSIPYEANVGDDLAGPNILQVSNPINPVAGGFEPQGECSALVTGKPMVPGSLGGSPYQNIIPPQLSIPYVSGILTAPTYNVGDAIDEVVRCNCDCWLA